MTDQAQLSRIIRQWMDVFMHRPMRGWSHHVKASGMSMPQFSILMQLHYKGSCGISEISERFEVTTAAASQLVERLVQSGLIERTEHPDRKSTRLNSSHQLISYAVFCLEHTSELQSPTNLVCRLLLEKNKLSATPSS